MKREAKDIKFQEKKTKNSIKENVGKTEGGNPAFLHTKTELEDKGKAVYDIL